MSAESTKCSDHALSHQEQAEERGWGCTGLLKELLHSHSKQLSEHFSLAEQLIAAYRTHVDYSSLCNSLYESTVAPENPAREVLFLFRDQQNPKGK